MSTRHTKSLALTVVAGIVGLTAALGRSRADASTGTERTYSQIISPNFIQNPGFEQWS